MNRNEKTSIAKLWLAILVLEVIFMVDAYQDYQVHRQCRVQQQENQEMILEKLEEEIHNLDQINHQFHQILNTVEADEGYY